MENTFELSVTVNGTSNQKVVDPRTLLSDFLRNDLDLTGTHVGCEHGVCGACTILLNGDPVRSCLLFTPQVNGQEIITVECLETVNDMHPLQEAFRESLL